LNLVSGALTLGFFAAVLGAGWLRSRLAGGYPVVQTSAALIAAFMLWSKVTSPQYALWLLPFFVLLDVGLQWWVAYAVVDVMSYVGVFRFFYQVCSSAGCQTSTELTSYQRLMIAGVGLRAILLLILVVVFLRSERARPAVASHPPSRLGGVGDPGEQPV
jgi:hypothetical protein